jgi:argininosuccinate synthase
MPEKVVLAYSGGLDTSIIIPWLKENYSYNVIAMVGDVGQGDDIEAVVEKAYATGASKVLVEDLREEFLTGNMFFRRCALVRCTNISICWARRWRGP